MKIKFHGVRGSIPVCGEGFQRYGGNTTCLRIYRETANRIVIIDAGTGIRNLGKELVAHNIKQNPINILFSHFHWDHIQGFPFFAPAYNKNQEIGIHVLGTKLIQINGTGNCALNLDSFKSCLRYRQHHFYFNSYCTIACSSTKERKKACANICYVYAFVTITIISLILKLQGNLFTIFSMDISGKDLILIVGGLFLLYKSASEIYHKMEGQSGDTSKNIKVTTFTSAISQILILDLVFSLDSIITAVGLVDALWIMYVAVIISVGIMSFASEPISKSVNNPRHLKYLH